ncbi:UNVERIFIED_CONTAM: hypothetical protein Sradi_1342200 [Sesamum radiatum]|uniref:Uncharacterized protein n=1 Tax=Sesamum radiatum TaxID=300843 RepID=A0AAW2UR78_SESRA
MRRSLQAHAERRNAKVERGISLPSRDVSAGSRTVGERYGSRLASWGRLRKDIKVCVPRASMNMGILDRQAHDTRSNVVLATFNVEDTRRTVGKL